VTVRLVTEAGRPVRIDVTDTGIGIPPDRLDAIFDAFTQAEATTERRFGGTGLGLTISRSLLRLMGADLQVSSVVGSGSTFSIILPRPGGESPAAPGSGPLVLIVDDDVHTRQLLSALLAAEGYRFATAREGRDALTMLGHERPGLILLDLKMPVMNGREFLRALRADPRYAGIPVVVVTSLDRDDPELDGVPAQVSAVLSKGPALEQALPEVLRRVAAS
ncbi:MAG TPA: response regulator, partial [Gemmatimonadales bacterium]|nr:response regulator [Gemmatimonadales bacterium]